MFINSRYWLLGLLLTFLVSKNGLADEPNNQSFGYGKKFVGLQVGYGDGVGFDFMGNGDGRLVRYLALSPQFGVGVSDLLGGNAWYKGNFDVVLQGEFIKNFRPSSGFSAGFSTLVRYNFRQSHTLVPYIEAGGGIGYLDFDLRDQSDGVIFYPQVGAGVHLFVNENTSIDLSYRLHHMSNSGITKRNNSINANLFQIGLSFYLD